jgi:predicted nucleic acid-binding protein
VILTDVNVLIYAHREDAVDHRRFVDWIEAVVAGFAHKAQSAH